MADARIELRNVHLQYLRDKEQSLANAGNHYFTFITVVVIPQRVGENLRVQKEVNNRESDDSQCF